MDAYKTKIYGHRGASDYAPENSMEAFNLAYEMKACGVEFDVQLTKDNQIVIIHDETIDRTSNGNGNVSDFTLKELRSFDFNCKNRKYQKSYENSENKIFENIKIPLLSEVLEQFKNKDFLFNIELKNNIINYENLEEKTLSLIKEFGFLEKTIFSSFSHKSMCKMKKLSPSANIAFLYSTGIMDEVCYLDKYNISIANPVHFLCNTYEKVDEFHKGNKSVNVWTVNQGSLIRLFCDFGVDGIITNRPDLAVEIKNDVKCWQIQHSW